MPHLAEIKNRHFKTVLGKELNADENVPQILARTWQPNKNVSKPLPKDEMFTLDDFDIN